MSNPVSQPKSSLPAGASAPLPAESDAAYGVQASALIDEEAGWLPADAERRAAFLQVFRFWHARVQPQYASQATPAFLYLLGALPVLIESRDALKAQRLWEPKSEALQTQRELHPAWKKYCEFLPRAQQASAEIKAYRTVSLVSGLDDLLARVRSAEKMYRQA
jgi:hypothetical protein